jgi:hypothetical protein
MTVPAGVDRLRIVVLGYVVRGPLGGMAWSDLHYVLGLRDLGHDVWFLEDSDDYPSCVDPVRRTVEEDPAYGLRFAADLFERVGLGDRWAYHDAHTGSWYGEAASRIRAVCADTDLVLNLAGVNPLRPWVADVPARVLVDKDPVFTQLRHLHDPAAMERAALHTAFFTFAENVGRPECGVPADGLPWQPTRHPIWLEGWPATPRPARTARFTTVMQWESYPGVEHDGTSYGTKADSFGPYLDLPRAVRGELELTIGGSAAPVQLLRSHGWEVRDSMETVPDPWAYRAYVQGSAAELAVAKHAYVVGRTGWFSERSASYLASGRPVVAQDTGFSTWLPPGEGVVSFSNHGEAAAAVEDVLGRYERHAAAAHELAGTYFDSRPVLASLVERAVSPSPASSEPETALR